MSDKPKWTPGPWRVGCPHHTTTKGALPIVAMEHVHVAAVGYDSVQTTSEHEANARLIAAAPLMAEALRRAREYVPADGDDERDMLEVIDAALRAAGVE